MRNIWTIAKREYKLYFMSPVAYVVAFLFLIWIGRIYYLNLKYAIQQAMYQPSVPTAAIVVSPMILILVFTMPAITMRLLAEEQRSGTIELLLTAPVRDWDVVVGKWLGGFLYMLTLLAITWIFPIVMNLIITPGIDQGLLVSGYLGIILITASLLAIGVAISAIFANQVVAFFVGLGVALVLILVQPSTSGSVGTWSDIVTYMNYLDHFNNFYQGVIDLKDVVYYLSVTAVGLFAGSLFVQSRRWR
jgi:gliding motility-associated transport system permease protein